MKTGKSRNSCFARRPARAIVNAFRCVQSILALSPFVPSPLAGEGAMVCPRFRMGEGFFAAYPSPIIACGSTEVPSPARGEGTTTTAEPAARRRTVCGNSISRCQTAHLVPAAHVCTRGLHPCFTDPESRGGRSAEKRSGARRNTREACHLASKTRVNALMTRHARRLARRLASHDAGRSSLGAPPWRFWAPGAALASPAFAPDRLASSSHPGRSAWRAGSLPPGTSGYKPRAAGRHASLRIQDRL